MIWHLLLVGNMTLPLQQTLIVYRTCVYGRKHFTSLLHSHIPSHFNFKLKATNNIAKLKLISHLFTYLLTYNICQWAWDRTVLCQRVINGVVANLELWERSQVFFPSFPLYSFPILSPRFPYPPLPSLIWWQQFQWFSWESTYHRLCISLQAYLVESCCLKRYICAI